MCRSYGISNTAILAKTGHEEGSLTALFIIAHKQGYIAVVLVPYNHYCFIAITMIMWRAASNSSTTRALVKSTTVG
jgi:hypothetical protein